MIEVTVWARLVQDSGCVNNITTIDNSSNNNENNSRIQIPNGKERTTRGCQRIPRYILDDQGMVETTKMIKTYVTTIGSESLKSTGVTNVQNQRLSYVDIIGCCMCKTLHSQCTQFARNRERERVREGVLEAVFS